MDLWNCFLPPSFSDMCGEGVDALVAAARNGKLSEVQMLLDCPEIDINGYEDGTKGPALIEASIRGYVEVVKELLKDVNIDTNKLDKANDIYDNKGGQTPLCLASKYGNLEVIKELLLDARVDPNLKNKYGDTPLIMAVRKNQTEAVKLLLRCPRVDITLSSSNPGNVYDYGKTALDIAKWLGATAIEDAIRSRPTLLEEDGNTCNEQGDQK